MRLKQFPCPFPSLYFQQTNLLKQVNTSIVKNKNFKADIIVVLGSKPTFTNYEPVSTLTIFL